MEFLSIFVSIFFNQTIKIKGPAILIFLSLYPMFSSPYSYHHLFSPPTLILFCSFPSLLNFYIYSSPPLASFLSFISFVFIQTPSLFVLFLPPKIYSLFFSILSTLSSLFLFSFVFFFLSLYFSIMKNSSHHLASSSDFLTNSAIFFLSCLILFILISLKFLTRQSHIFCLYQLADFINLIILFNYPLKQNC